MTEVKGAAQTDLERLLAELVSPDRRVRLDAVRRINHVHQRPDLATVDALLEISYQLWRLAESYEIVNAVEPRRAALEKARFDARMEERAKQPPPPPPPPRVSKEESYEYNDTDLDIRTYNALTRRGSEYHTQEQILEMVPHKIKNFGRVSFTDLVVGLIRNKVRISVIKASTLWVAAPQAWRDYAQAHLDQGRQPLWKQGPAEVKPITDSQETDSSEA